MKQPIRVLALPLYPKQFSSRIRVGFMEAPIRELGIKLDVADPLLESQFNDWYSGDFSNRFRYHLTEGFNRVLQIQQSQQYDVLWIQKGLALFPWRFLNLWKSLFSNRVVVDLDDDVLESPPIEIISWRRILGDPDQMKNLVASADWITSGNETLSESLRDYNSNVLTVPSTIPLSEYSIEKDNRFESDVPTIVWIGTGSNRPYLNRLAPVLSRLAGRINRLRLLVISDSLSGIRTDEFGRCEIQLKKWVPSEEHQLLRKGWVGIMPLDASEWAEKKSGYKILQYFASGLPAVASPVGVNQSLIQEGTTGSLPSSDNEWEEALYSLLTDPSKRKDLGSSGRRMVEDGFSSEKWAMVLADLFEKLGGRNRL